MVVKGWSRRLGTRQSNGRSYALRGPVGRADGENVGIGVYLQAVVARDGDPVRGEERFVVPTPGENAQWAGVVADDGLHARAQKSIRRHGAGTGDEAQE